jgi:glyoxylase-like metal-dependent hydrolase (beta-lactamase superfamily II)
MRRGIVLGSVIVLGTLGVLRAQQPADAPKVVEVEKVKDNLFVLRGGGGNTAVFVTADGVTVVDAKNPGWGTPILQKIRELTPKPVTRLINTHTHGDHVSGNVEFPASVEVVAHANTKTNMEKMPIFKEHNGHGLADKTFTDRMTIGTGADRIDLYYFGPGHTNGDAWVVFPAHRIVHAGDIFAGKSLPLIDVANGGSQLRIPDTLLKAYTGIRDVDTIINGHMPRQTSWAELKEFADFNRDVVTWMRAQLEAGKTPEQAAAEWKVPERYKDYSSTVSPLFGGVAGRVKALQDEMRK